MSTLGSILGTCALATALLLGSCEERTVSVSADANVRVTDLRDGFGEKAVDGMLVHVHYTGMLEDGTVVVDTYERGRTHKFIVGDGTVIPGMDKGVLGMRSGGKRKIVMPPQAHYGKHGYAGKIPADTTMTFEVEMLRVRRPDSVSGGELHPSDPRRRRTGQRAR